MKEDLNVLILKSLKDCLNSSKDKTFGLIQGECDEVYWAVCELVKNRLEKVRGG